MDFMGSKFTRRQVMQTLGATAATTAMMPLGGRALRADEATTITVTSYGGNYQESQDTAFFKPFQALNPSIKILQDSPESDAKLKAMVEAGNVTWDVVLVADNFGQESDAKWLEPIDYSIIDKSQFLDGYAGTYRVGADVEGTVIGYRNDVFKDAKPQTLADFFDLKKFPGKRCAWKYAPGGIFEAALIADGVDPKALYPLDIPRALKKLDTIRDNLIWWETGAQSEQLLTTGEAALGFVWIGRAVHAAEVAPVSIAWGQWLSLNGFWVVPKGTRNKKAAMEALKYFTSAEAQVALTKLLPYGPTNKNAVDKVDARYRGNLPTDHLDTQVKVDFAWWGANQNEVDSTFQEWLLG